MTPKLPGACVGTSFAEGTPGKLFQLSRWQSPTSLALTLAENSGIQSRRVRRKGIQTDTHRWMGNRRPDRLGQDEPSQENGVLLACLLGCTGVNRPSTPLCPQPPTPPMIRDL